MAKIRQQILEISRKHKTTTSITDGRTDGQRHGRTTRKHIASAGAYRRRRLKKVGYLKQTLPPRKPLEVLRPTQSSCFIHFTQSHCLQRFIDQLLRLDLQETDYPKSVSTLLASAQEPSEMMRSEGRNTRRIERLRADCGTSPNALGKRYWTALSATRDMFGQVSHR